MDDGEALGLWGGYPQLTATHWPVLLLTLLNPCIHGPHTVSVSLAHCKRFRLVHDGASPNKVHPFTIQSQNMRLQNEFMCWSSRESQHNTGAYLWYGRSICDIAERYN